MESDDRGETASHESRQGPKAVEVTVGETVLESNIAALDMTKVAQGTAKTCQAPSCRWLRLTREHGYEGRLLTAALMR